MTTHTQEANETNFAEITSKGTTIIDFWAPWCGPCQQLGPVMEKLAEEMKGKVNIFKVNIDENPNIATQMGIRGIPTVMMFKDGQTCFTHSGAYPKDFWVENINKHI